MRHSVAVLALILVANSLVPAAEPGLAVKAGKKLPDFKEPVLFDTPVVAPTAPPPRPDASPRIEPIRPPAVPSPSPLPTPSPDR